MKKIKCPVCGSLHHDIYISFIVNVGAEVKEGVLEDGSELPFNKTAISTITCKDCGYKWHSQRDLNIEVSINVAPQKLKL